MADMSQVNEQGLVEYTVTDGVAVVRIDRPKVNVLDKHLQALLADAAHRAAADDAVAAVVLTGGERVFAAGVDVVEMAAMSHADMAAHAPVMGEAFSAWARLPKPVVAAVNGYALGGGCELALCADVRIAGDSAVFGQPEIKLGIIPGAGGTQRLTRLVGPARAKELIFTGRQVPAAEALAMGLVNEVVPAADTISRATAWAAQFVDGPALALRFAKEAINAALDTDLETGLAFERGSFVSLFATPDRTTGMTSFLEHGPGKARFGAR